MHLSVCDEKLFTKQHLLPDFPNLSKINLANSKFANISAHDMDRLLATEEAVSTQTAVKPSVVAFQQFLECKKESTEFEVATKSDLNAQLRPSHL